jgi:hypothetical protein
MPADLEFLSPGDKPALLALTNYELLANVQSVLAALDYKMHIASGHEEFDRLFSAVQYPLVVLEDHFASTARPDNRSLVTLQQMPMNLRRHAVIALLGDGYETMNALQAFQQSVHVVIHRADLPGLGRILLKTIADNDLFLGTFRDIQNRLATGEEI